VHDAARTLTGDRKEFLGRGGRPGSPRGAAPRAPLRQSWRRLDPCGALQVTCELTEGQEREITFRLGVGRNSADVQALIQRFRPSRRESRRARGRLGILEENVGGCAGRNARSFHPTS